ncbi:uncharacterized protein [Bos taurus]|uniref:uncharacterized protein isoform X6 n=1 Tax=Bos taurus TaxID=9913 RepID=UPI0028CBB0E9|nr:uncharacterized protein LOC101903854 isoform X6 [Bos taurus]
MLDAARPRPPAPPPLPPGALHRLYAWLDALPPSRRKRHLARDFSDGGKSSTSWVSVSQEEIRKVIVNTPGAIEPILCAVRDKVEASRTRPAWLDTSAWVQTVPPPPASPSPCPSVTGRCRQACGQGRSQPLPGVSRHNAGAPCRKQDAPVVTLPGSPGSTWTLGCRSGCWRRRSGCWQSCGRPSRHQRPRVRGCRLTGLATQTYWTASSRALGPSQGAEGSSLRRKPGSGALALFWASLFPLSLRVSSTPGFRRCLGVTAVQQPLRALSAMPACSGWASRLYVWTWDSGGWGVQATQPRCRRSCRNGDDKALPAGSASLDAAFLRKQEGGVILWFASAGWQGGSPVSARPLAALIPCPVWAVC